MYIMRIKNHLAVFSVCLLILSLTDNKVYAVEQTEVQEKTVYTLTRVASNVQDGSLTVRFFGDSQPTFASRELHDPNQLVIDVTGLRFGSGVDAQAILPKTDIASLQTTVVKGLKPEITRFVFTISEGYGQKLDRKGNDLVLTIFPTNNDFAEQEAAAFEKFEENVLTESQAELEVDGATESPILDLIELSDKEYTDVDVDQPKDSFGFAGYKRERISIDFYKADLHNVFRLFRQISGANLIIDEEVGGTLTLALKDVPWDFALDIILNLSELKKEEKFNTIVIYPKNKEFEWPERISDSLTYEENLEVVEQQALIIEQSANQPKEIMQAKDLMREAREKESRNEYEDAVELYQQAFELWPENDALATRLAALYLVRLGMNAKGVFYAKKSLAVQPDKNYKAALYAAIGSANMNRVAEAVEYFNQSISGDPPMKEALASFAAFSESAQRYEAAIKLYDKYHEYYGETVNTMIAKARIYDLMGEEDMADEQYKSVLQSGFQVQTALRKYIESRISNK